MLELDVETTLEDILNLMEIERRVVIGVNGAHERDHLRQLQDGDEVKVFSAVSGG